MLALRKLTNYQIVRRMSDLTIRESQPSKFAVVNGKFIRVPQKDVPSISEEITHTGQVYEENDCRRMRFLDRTKLVNRNWAINMIAEIPPIEVEGRKAVCDGSLGSDDTAALGHPRVYLNLDKGEPVSCPYCGLRYVQKKSDDEEEAKKSSY